MEIDQLFGGRDLNVGVFSDEKWAAWFEFSADAIYSTFETGVTAPFEANVSHEFEFRSTDMRSYTLLIDGAPAINGSFWPSLTASRVGWGDGIQGGRSLSRWEYFRVGVVPEPSTLQLLVVIGTFLVLRER